jgi:amidase
VRDTAIFVDALDRRLPGRSLPPIGLVREPAAQRLRIGVYTDSPLGGDVDPEVRDATLAAARSCEALGHRVEEIRCPYGRQLLIDSWAHIEMLAWLFKLQMRVLRGLRFKAGALEPWTRGLAERAKPFGIVAVARRLRASQRISTAAFETRDILLCPTLAKLPPVLGWLDPALTTDHTLPRQQQLIPFTPIQNATGDPAISLPMAVGAAGLPIGVQFAAPLGGEATLLALAHELESAQALHLLG